MKKLLYSIDINKLVSLKNFGWVLLLITSYFLIVSGCQKLIGEESMVKLFSFLKIPQLRLVIGLLEISAGLLILFPKTSLYGSVLATLILIGAFFVHIFYLRGLGYQAAIILSLTTWSGYFLRRFGFFDL